MDENAFKNGDGEGEMMRESPKDNNKNAIDDIPIPVSKPKTFEELLEEEMAKGNAGGIVANVTQRSPNREQQIGSAAQKREFLKRKQPSYGVPVNTNRNKNEDRKSYRYYADNFAGGPQGAGARNN